MKTVMNRLKIKQAGLSLVELMVSIAISMTVLSGVVQVLVVSKSNFVTEKELATLQENARFAIKFMADEIRMAGFTGCSSTPLYVANALNGSAGSWYLGGAGLQGFDYDAGASSFPVEFRADVAPNTDSVVIRRGEKSGLAISSHNSNSAQLGLNQNHSLKKGQIIMMTTPDCQQVGIMQMSNTNDNNTISNVVHNTGSGTSPGNCTKYLGGNFTCASGTASSKSYGQGSSIMTMRSEAYYVGVSELDSTVPALHRERLLLNTSTDSVYTAAEELVQGVENMQILYGLDNAFNDGIADMYVKANSGLMNWNNVVSVRLSLRMRSIFSVYNENVDFPEFDGVTGTDGSDRFMRQTVTTTIQIRNS